MGSESKGKFLTDFIAQEGDMYLLAGGKVEMKRLNKEEIEVIVDEEMFSKKQKEVGCRRGDPVSRGEGVKVGGIREAKELREGAGEVKPF